MIWFFLSEFIHLQIFSHFLISTGEDNLEFVEVSHVELPSETWDSYESSELYEYHDNTQANAESTATSTTRTTKRKNVIGMAFGCSLSMTMAS